MKRYASLALAVLLSGCAAFKPPEDWSQADRIREIALLTSLTADAITTSRISTVPTLIEGNGAARLFIGSRPSPNDVLVGSLVLGLTYHVVLHRLPSRWRKALGYVGIGGHVQGAAQNCDNGLC